MRSAPALVLMLVLLVQALLPVPARGGAPLDPGASERDCSCLACRCTNCCGPAPLRSPPAPESSLPTRPLPPAGESDFLPASRFSSVPVPGRDAGRPTPAWATPARPSTVPLFLRDCVLLL